MKITTLREVGFLALVPEQRRKKREADQTPDEVIPEIEVVLRMHHNQKLYNTPGAAQAQAKERVFSRAKQRMPLEGRVLIVDTAILEPVGLTAQEQYEFAERLSQYWAIRAIDAQTRAAAGEDPIAPEVTRPRRKPRSRRPRAPQPAGPTLGPMATQLLTGAAAVVIGNLLSKAIERGEAPASYAPDTSRAGTLNTLLGAGGLEQLATAGLCRAKNLASQAECLRENGHTGPHARGTQTWTNT